MSLKNLVNRTSKNVAISEKLGDSPNGENTITVGSMDYLLTEGKNYLEDDDLAEVLLRLGTELKGGLIDRKQILLECYRVAFSQEERTRGCFHPSEISTDANPCKRKMYFQKADIDKDATFIPFTSDNRMQRLVDLGSMVHLFIQENLDRVKLLDDFETVVNEPSYGLAGKTDGIVEFSGFDSLGNFYMPTKMILEVKTINDRGFKALRKWKPEHLKQASIYGDAIGLEYILFLYYNKNDSDIKLYVSPLDFDYADWFRSLGEEIVSLYNSNVRKYRTRDITKHLDMPVRACSNRTCERAMECAYSDYCFTHNI